MARHGAGVAVGVSGGVDSAVAALLLRDAGYDVRGVFLRLWPGDDPRSCCSPAAERRAAAAAAHLGLPFDVLDLRAEFDARVVEPFVQAYLNGLTPNPCVGCNPFRFARLHEWAAERGVGLISSGHYAALVREEGGAWLRRGRDPGKDQSYMFARVPPEILDAMLLPLGELSKVEVRQRARTAGLALADQQESQEVCFACDGYRGFLRERGVHARRGEIVDESGVPLGEHRGHWEYTVGQRRGLGVVAEKPLFVIERRATRNEVVVGPRERLSTAVVEVDEVDDRGLRWLRAARGASMGSLSVQLRYRSPAVPVEDVDELGGGRLRVTLAAPFEAPAAGQAAVFYEGSVVRAAATLTALSGSRGAPAAARV